jgi:putative transcriptional regulator
MDLMARVLIPFLFALAGFSAQAQQHLPANGLFLIAKPSLVDPNFQKTVVLVTQTEDASTVGVIINRPSTLKLSQFLSPDIATQNYREPIFIGGPVMRQIMIAVYRSSTVPEAPAFHVLKDVYLTMHPDNIGKLLADPKARYRLYAGFAGWEPHQLENEFERDGWYILPADDQTLFREKPEGLWEELVEKAMRRDPKSRS